jgi:hypothetical protein
MKNTTLLLCPRGSRLRAGADFTVAQIAARFGRHPSTVRGWCDAGLIRGAYKFMSKEWRIPVESLPSFEESQRNLGSSDPRSVLKSGESRWWTWGRGAGRRRMPKKKRSRICTRNQGGATRYYADFRTYRDVGGRMEPLTAKGERWATTDRDVADVLAAARLQELDAMRRGRALPLWEQLEQILRPWVFGTDRPPGRLLFPSYVVGREAMLTDWRRRLDRIAVRAGWKKGEVRSRQFRHTYTAARLQTLDQGAPVSPYTVSRELGHGSRAMVENIYSHLGAIRHRSEVVEYRVEQFATQLGPRLEALTGP